MTTQYGFYIDSSRCTGCKTCELACKDFKNLTPDVSFRRIYEYAGGTGRKITVCITKMCLPIISPFRVTTVAILPVPKCVRAARCTNERMALSSSMKRFALVVAIAIWPARMALLSTMRRRGT